MTRKSIPECGELSEQVYEFCADLGRIIQQPIISKNGPDRRCFFSKQLNAIHVQIRSVLCSLSTMFSILFLRQRIFIKAKTQAYHKATMFYLFSA